MQQKQLYEYAIIRLVPRVEREEFLNIGVVLYCRKCNYLACDFSINETRLKELYADIDIPQVEKYLQAFKKIAGAHPDGGPIAKLDTASRFRWLTATRSTIVQTSKVHPAFCTEPSETLQTLLREFVL